MATNLYHYVTGVESPPYTQEDPITLEEFEDMVEEAVLWRRTSVRVERPFKPQVKALLKEQGFRFNGYGQYTRTISWPRNDPAHYEKVEFFEDLTQLLETRIPSLPDRYSYVSKFYPQYLKEYEKIVNLEYIFANDDNIEEDKKNSEYFMEWYPGVSHIYLRTRPLSELVGVHPLTGSELRTVSKNWTLEQFIHVYDRPELTEEDITRLLYELSHAEAYPFDKEACRWLFSKLPPSSYSSFYQESDNYHTNYRNAAILEMGVRLGIIPSGPTEEVIVYLMKYGIVSEIVTGNLSSCNFNLEISGSTFVIELIKYIRGKNCNPRIDLKIVKILRMIIEQKCDLEKIATKEGKSLSHYLNKSYRIVSSRKLADSGNADSAKVTSSKFAGTEKVADSKVADSKVADWHGIPVRFDDSYRFDSGYKEYHYKFHLALLYRALVEGTFEE